MREQSPKLGIDQETIERNNEGGFARFKTLAIVTGLLAVTGGAYAAGERNSGPENRGEAAAATNEEDAMLSETAGDLARGKFLPESEDGQINSDEEAEEYVKELFDKDGPLANEINPASLSIMDAAVTQPATGNTVDTTLDIRNQYLENRANFTAAGGSALAQESSATLRAIANTDFRYESAAASRGDVLTEIAPATSDNDPYASVTYKKVVAKHDMPGLVLKVRGEDSITVDGKEIEVSGYGEYLLPGDGSILRMGMIEVPKPAKKKGPEKAPNGKDKDDDKAPAGTNQTQGTNTGPSNNGTGGGSSTGNNANNSVGEGTGGGANSTSGECGGCGDGTGGGGGETGSGCSGCGSTGGGTTPNPGGECTTCGGGGSTPTPDNPEPTPEPGKPVDPGLV